MSQDEWVNLARDAAQASARKDEEARAELASSEHAALLAPADELARARMAASLPWPEVKPEGAIKRVRTWGRGRRAMTLAGPLAAAAAIALWLGTGGHGAPLPEYEVATRGAPAAMRGASSVSTGAAATAIEVNAHGEVNLVFRPVAAIQGAIVAEAFVVDASGAHAWKPPMEISPEGAVRIAGASDAVFGGRSGAFDVVLVAARPGGLPDEAHALDSLSGKGGELRAVRLHVTITP
jgi:hypothetical protein